MAKKILYIPDVLQFSDFDCGDSCTQAILAYYGEDINEIKLIEKLKTSKKDGTSSKHIVEYFKSRKFKVKDGPMSLKQLKIFIDKKRPVILFIQAWGPVGINYKNTVAHGHYVIACGYDSTKVYFEDPAVFGTAYLTYKELEKRWHGEDGKDEYLSQYGIAIWKTGRFNYKKPIKIK
ncbi:MAG: cysteine peptidase family C39 domain-containing protein [Ignavibacteriae bacterium]|nr:cysteine peptidase family C39 domain-containing protein [Ignavibacteriota bacterium]